MVRLDFLSGNRIAEVSQKYRNDEKSGKTAHSLRWMSAIAPG
ncbi:MAG: hypothetical protein ACRCT1_13165 [Microcoleaceae cyanobacterium]